METEESLRGRVFLAAPGKTYGASLLRVASSFWHTSGKTTVSDLAAEFHRKPELMSVGVVDEQGAAVGIISRMGLFGMLGKPFGREVLSKRPISEIVEDAETFDRHDNLFRVAQSIRDKIDLSVVSYYLVVGNAGEFAGIFSSKDLLFYLSILSQEDMSMAAALQERLVHGEDRHAGEGWRYEAFSQSAKGLGGDFHHMTDLGNGKVFIAAGDVSGKGAAASILTALLWGVLRFYDFSKGLRSLLLQLNEALIGTFRLEKYLTGFFMIVDVTDGVAEIADMGHGLNWIYRNGRMGPLKLPVINLPLGIETNLDPKIVKVRLLPGDRVMVNTDGLTEQEDKNETELGTGRMLETARQAIDAKEDLIGAMQGMLAAHQGSMPQLDDATCMVFSLGAECVTPSRNRET